MNYPVREQKDKEFVAQFIKIAIKNSLSFNLQNIDTDSIKSTSPNLYYLPKPNEYLELDEIALFSATAAFSVDNYEVEMLYRRGLLSVGVRNKIHPFLRQKANIPEKILSKKIFKESRKLFNIAYLWQNYEVSIEQKEYDLVQNLRDFYPATNRLSVSLTNACNLKCIMCMLHSEKAKTAHLPNSYYSKTKKLSDELLDHCINYAIKYDCVLDFTCGGEVLLDSRIYSAIQKARKGGVRRVGFTSNATLLDSEKTEKLLDSGITYIRFSIDGADKETYRKIRGADLEKVEANVINFIKRNYERRANVEIAINCVLVEGANISVEDYKKKWLKYKEYLNYISFVKEIHFDENGFYDDPRVAINATSARYVCHWPWWDSLSVLADGRVYACCAMGSTIGRKGESIVGDINKQSLDEIWFGKEMNTLRRENLTLNFKHFEVCKKCVEWRNGFMEDDGSGRNVGETWDNR